MNTKKLSVLNKEYKNLKGLVKEGLELVEAYKKEAQYWKDMCKYLDICTRRERTHERK
ncbi:hypothetical protein [Clostridium rectalis]|uniref:hypothetical protein n=1 Tax=Clostridium rectalis TaxID=2040295 RepID=UPI0013DE33F6|nr:hypothetical protein [Clostridium rectalis]